MKKFTVSFFGEGLPAEFFKAEHRLEKVILTLLLRLRLVEFRITGADSFNFFAEAVIRRIQKEFNNSCSLVLLLTPPADEYKSNKEAFMKYYDRIEICSPKDLVRSDLIICHTRSLKGCRAVRNAEKQGKYVVNLAQPDGNK